MLNTCLLPLRQKPASMVIAALLLASPSVITAKAQNAAAANSRPSDVVSRVPGVALPNREVTLGAPVDAMLLSFEVEEEDTVESGQILAQMDNRVQTQLVEAARLRAESQSAILAAEARQQLAKVQLDGRLKAFVQSAATQLEVDEAKASFEEAKAGVQAAKDEQAVNATQLQLEQARLEVTRLRAPFAGIVLEKMAEAGDAMRITDDVLILINIDTLKAEIAVPADKGAPVVGQTYQLHAGAPINAPLTARCKRVASMMNVSGQSFRCEFEIDNPEHKMTPGFHVWLVSLEPVQPVATAVAE